MKQVTFHAAKIHLSKLIEATLNGEEIVIARGSSRLDCSPVSSAPFRTSSRRWT